MPSEPLTLTRLVDGATSRETGRLSALAVARLVVEEVARESCFNCADGDRARFESGDWLHSDDDDCDAADTWTVLARLEAG